MVPLELLREIGGALLLIAGAFFFTAGTVGLIRFPDVRSRLHALAKADTLGLGLVLLGVGVLLGSWTVGVVLLATWILALGAASVSAHVLARLEREQREGAS
ncbi:MULTISPECIES: monovalent cation/H(+) antiporter subunit G [Actinomycetes]|uniref:Monovalent cation/H(+) antiporter subunit G n=2 Tax=Actinomycetes TaxID=1760 RepID=A0ABP6M324_9MICC